MRTVLADKAELELKLAKAATPLPYSVAASVSVPVNAVATLPLCRLLFQL